MPFKFNFNSESETADKEDSTDTSEPAPTIEAVLLSVENRHKENVQNAEVCEIKVGEKVLKYVSTEAAEEQLKRTNSEVAQAVKDFSDLIPNIYEGGLKIWECSIDLTKFLSNNRIPLENRNVLELGCGAGLPALYAHVSGSTCCFQDFNKEVIDLLTIPNVILNTLSSTNGYEKASFISGDWASVPEILEKFPRFDVILSSETIYNKNSQKSLLNLMKKVLHRNGSIFLAAKTCYFGVGGSLRQFEDLLIADGTFNFTTAWKTEEGVQREILRLTFK